MRAGLLAATIAAAGLCCYVFDTGREYDAVNGVVARGILYVVSGEGRFTGCRGNALIALSVDGK
jgi:hypothetical protein